MVLLLICKLWIILMLYPIFDCFGVCISLPMVVVSYNVEFSINITNQTSISEICPV